MVFLGNSILWQSRADGAAGGIVLAIALGDGPLHDCSDPLAHPSRGLAFLIPDWQQDGHDVRRGDITHVHLTQPWHRIVPQTCPPLCGGLSSVLPSRLVDSDHCLGGVRERRNILPGTQRTGITTSSRQLPVVERRLARLAERDVGPAAQAEVKALAVDRAAPYPLLAAGWDHAQDQAVLVVVLVRAARLPLCRTPLTKAALR